LTQSRHLLRLNQTRLRRLKVAIGGLGGVARRADLRQRQCRKTGRPGLRRFLAEDFRAIPP
jgi:hypothetical protein